MKKIILAVICLVTVITATILPTFAWQSSTDTASYADCVFTLNGKGTYLNDAYYTNQGEYYFNTFGDVLLFTAPRLMIWNNRWVNLPYQGEEASYYVYFNADDNSGQWVFKIFDYVMGDWYSYNATDTNIYAFFVNDYVPIIYNQNIHQTIAQYKNALGKDFSFWSCFKTADATMIVIPTRYNNTIGYNGGFEKGYTQGHGEGYEQGYGAGKDAGLSQGINTKTTFLDGLQMIFTAPGYFINSIFDFELFGFNMANVIRAILTLALVGVVVVLFVKFL